MNRTSYTSFSLGVMNGYGLMYCGNWTASGQLVKMEFRTGLFPSLGSLLLSEIHKVTLCLLVLWDFSGQRLNLSNKNP